MNNTIETKDCDRCHQELSTRWTVEEREEDETLIGYMCMTCHEVWDITGPFTGRRFLDGKEIEAIEECDRDSE